MVTKSSSRKIAASMAMISSHGIQPYFQTEIATEQKLQLCGVVGILESLAFFGGWLRDRSISISSILSWFQPPP